MIPTPQPPPASCSTYYVDEAGDGVIFDRKGRVLIGETTPRFFMLGMIRATQDADHATRLRQLREELMANPLYAGIPSLQPEAKKTALFFHAKDDHPEIRAKVFETLTTLDFQFFAVIKDMQAVLNYVKERNAMDSSYRYHPNELYDLTTRRLFQNQLNQQDAYAVTFARRGKSDRSKALLEQLHIAQTRGETSDHPHPSIKISPRYPWEAPCLQIADYCLWALQRSYEKGESRFLKALWPKVSLIVDIDDPNGKTQGTYLTSQSAIPLDTKNRKI